MKRLHTSRDCEGAWQESAVGRFLIADSFCVDGLPVSCRIVWQRLTEYTEISQMKRPCVLLTLKNISITIYATCVKSYIAGDQISHIINQVPDFVHLRNLPAFQFETRRK